MLKFVEIIRKTLRDVKRFAKNTKLMPKQSAARNDKAPKEYQQLSACNAKLWPSSPADQQEATNRHQWSKLKEKFSKNLRGGRGR